MYRNKPSCTGDVCQFVLYQVNCDWGQEKYSRRLKLLTGVETSTLPVNRSGNEGKRQIRSRRKTKAALKTATFCRSTAMALCQSTRIIKESSVVLPVDVGPQGGGATEPATHGPPASPKKVIEKFSFSYQQNCLALLFRTPTVFTMARIKKKGMSGHLPYRFRISDINCRYLRSGQKLYHSYSGRAQTSDLFARFPSSLHFQG